MCDVQREDYKLTGVWPGLQVPEPPPRITSAPPPELHLDAAAIFAQWDARIAEDEILYKQTAPEILEKDGIRVSFNKFPASIHLVPYLP